MTGSELAITPDRQVVIDAFEHAVMEAGTVPNTREAFAQDWATWERFCTETGDPTTVPSSGLLVGFVVWLRTGDLDAVPARPQAAPSTITRRLSGVMHGWKSRGLVVPAGITANARKAITNYQRDLDRAGEQIGRGKAPPLSIPDLRRIALALPHTPAGIRDRALLVVGFGIGARRSELARLTFTDLTAEDRGIEIHVRASKGGKSRRPKLPMGTHPLTCPVRTLAAWTGWLASRGITSGPLFRRFRRGDGAMSPAACSDVITRAGELVGIEGLTCHSLRSGMATAARAAGHDNVTIARQGGWEDDSRVLFSYLHTVDGWTDNPLVGIGL